MKQKYIDPYLDINSLYQKIVHVSIEDKNRVDKLQENISY